MCTRSLSLSPFTCTCLVCVCVCVGTNALHWYIEKTLLTSSCVMSHTEWLTRKSESVSSSPFRFTLLTALDFTHSSELATAAAAAFLWHIELICLPLDDLRYWTNVHTAKKYPHSASDRTKRRITYVYSSIDHEWPRFFFFFFPVKAPNTFTSDNEHTHSHEPLRAHKNIPYEAVILFSFSRGSSHFSHPAHFTASACSFFSAQIFHFSTFFFSLLKITRCLFSLLFRSLTTSPLFLSLLFFHLFSCNPVITCVLFISIGELQATSLSLSLELFIFSPLPQFSQAQRNDFLRNHIPFKQELKWKLLSLSSGATCAASCFFLSSLSRSLCLLLTYKKTTVWFLTDTRSVSSLFNN